MVTLTNLSVNLAHVMYVDTSNKESYMLRYSTGEQVNLDAKQTREFKEVVEVGRDKQGSKDADKEDSAKSGPVKAGK